MLRPSSTSTSEAFMRLLKTSLLALAASIACAVALPATSLADTSYYGDPHCDYAIGYCLGDGVSWSTSATVLTANATVDQAYADPLLIGLNGSNSYPASGHQIVSYDWLLNGRIIGGGQGLAYRFAEPNQVYTVTLRVTDDTGASVSTTVDVKTTARILQRTTTATSAALFTANKPSLSKRGQLALNKLRPLVATATNVTVDTYTATSSKPASQKLSQQQANTVLRFLLGAKAPTGVKARAVGHGRTTKFGKSLAANCRTVIHITYLVK